MKQRNRYDPNDGHAYDGRPVKISQAKSPRNAPARITAGGMAGRVHGGRPADPTAGITGPVTGARRPAGNTMRNARMGGTRVRYFEPAEIARESLTYTSAPAPARVANRPVPAGTPYGHPAHKSGRPCLVCTLRTAGESDGIRQTAMTERSIMHATGAVRITYELRRVTDDYGDTRCIPVAVPHWTDCDCETCQPAD